MWSSRRHETGADPGRERPARGALAAMTRVPAGVPVVTSSAGNHGLGVAYVARGARQAGDGGGADDRVAGEGGYTTRT